MTTRSDWLAERKTGIGSSDAAAVLGLSRYKSALAVWLDKVGQAQPEAMNDAMRWGLWLEPALATAYTERTGLAAVVPPRALYRHPDRFWQIASPDRLAEGRIVELKTAGHRQANEWGDEGTDEIPEPYLIQVQHQMSVLDLPRADVAVLIGGQDFRVYSVARSEPLIERLTEIEGDFWEHVLRREAPPADWTHPATPQLIESMYQPNDGKTVMLPPEAEKLVELYEFYADQARDGDTAKKQVRAELVALLGDASLGLLNDGRRVKRKVTERKGYTVEPSTYVDFRILQPKLIKERV